MTHSLTVCSLIPSLPVIPASFLIGEATWLFASPRTWHRLPFQSICLKYLPNLSDLAQNRAEDGIGLAGRFIHSRSDFFLAHSLSPGHWRLDAFAECSGFLQSEWVNNIKIAAS